MNKLKSPDKLEEEKSSTLKNKMAAEKKHRDHILQLNQLLARQVMERSKVVAGEQNVNVYSSCMPH